MKSLGWNPDVEPSTTVSHDELVLKLKTGVDEEPEKYSEKVQIIQNRIKGIRNGQEIGEILRVRE